MKIKIKTLMTTLSALLFICLPTILYAQTETDTEEEQMLDQRVLERQAEAFFHKPSLDERQLRKQQKKLRALKKRFHKRVKLLKKRIKKNWKQKKVRRILGKPHRVYKKAGYKFWSYSHDEITIIIRNKRVVDWYFRFI